MACHGNAVLRPTRRHFVGWRWWQWCGCFLVVSHGDDNGRMKRQSRQKRAKSRARYPRMKNRCSDPKPSKDMVAGTHSSCGFWIHDGTVQYVCIFSLYMSLVGNEHIIIYTILGVSFPGVHVRFHFLARYPRQVVHVRPRLTVRSRRPQKNISLSDLTNHRIYT